MIHQFEQTIRKLSDFGLLTSFEEKQAEEFFLHVEKTTSPQTDYIRFLSEFNRITGKRYQGDVQSRKLYYKESVNYTLKELIQCVENAIKNPYFTKERPDIIKPEWILKKENLAEYFNYSAPKTQKNKLNGKDRSYTEIEL